MVARPGQDKDPRRCFQNHLHAQGGSANGNWVVVCDMAQAYPASETETFPNPSLTTDWFHITQRVTDAITAAQFADLNKEREGAVRRTRPA